jgi:hypothetical protein
MRHHGGRTLAIVGALAWACASPSGTDSEKVDATLSKYVLSAVPADVPNPTFVDFGGKVHLVGWEASPKGIVPPGGAITLKLYWRSVGKVARGYHLTTRLTAASGKVYAFDDVGPLRESVPDSELGKAPRLAPSTWVPGMVYVDEQTLTLPEDSEAGSLTLSVGVASELYAEGDGGVEKVGDFGLKVLSGVSDGKEGAVLARFAVPTRSKGQRGRRPGGMPLGRMPFAKPGTEKEKAP